VTPSRSLRDLSIAAHYSSGRSDLPAEFFGPCIEASSRYDRAVGFFSSTCYTLIDVPIAEFALRGGKLRLLCSPQLSGDDIAAIDAGYRDRAAGEAVLRELEQLLEDSAGAAAAKLLASLIAYGAADVRIAFRSGEAGIFHDKVGVFADEEGDVVSFSGSANETWSAWSGRANHESFMAFASWREHDAERVAIVRDYFEALWEGSEPDLEVIEFPQVARERLEEIAHPDGPAAAEEEMRSGSDRRPPRPTLRPHQRDAVAGWEGNGHRGILEHATGSGKTVTAMTCIERSLRAGRPALVLVPGLPLLHQWDAELRAFFGGEVEILRVSGEYPQWRQGSLLRDFLAPGGARKSLVLATMDTAAGEDFVDRIADLESVFLVADEVHRIGSERRQRILEAAAGWRLGLSATWRRERDPGGSQAILDFFERILEPPYTIADAIRDGYLCRYRYVLHRVPLSDAEREEWENLSARIGRALAAADGEMSETVERLLIARGRIVKGAEAKVGMAADLLARELGPEQAWLVYCDSMEQLDQLRRECDARGLHCFEYHTGMEGDRTAALAEFELNGGVMLSISCLDEGVDIPRISHALILASSSSRREFIQRRGRVLRQHETKHMALIHDAFVDTTGFEDPEAARFVRNELKRAWEFARSATESETAKVMLAQIAAEVGVSLEEGEDAS
jgi:superfamily II DNA or RNA helicase